MGAVRPKVKPWLVCGVAIALLGCGRRRPEQHAVDRPAAPSSPVATKPSIPKRPALAPLGPGETYRYEKGVATKMSVAAARTAGLLDVDLADPWAPLIFQDTTGPEDPAKPNAYRATFVALANEQIDDNGLPLRQGDHNYFEVFGIPPTLSVLSARIEEDITAPREACYERVDLAAMRQWTGNLGFIDRERSRRDATEALRDGEWIDKELAARRAGPASTTAARPAAKPSAGPDAGPAPRDKALAALREEPRARGRVDRYLRGQARLRAVRAAQARLSCEGLLGPKSHFVSGQYDLPTHEALATWERKHDVFGWGFLGGETLGLLLAPTRGLHLAAWKRLVAERVADAAGIVEDGSINRARRRNPPTFVDETGTVRPVPNLVDDHVRALLEAIGVATPEDLVAFLRAHAGGFGTLHVAFAPPALPPYYQPEEGGDLELSAEIDRGDVWYDFPFDRHAKPVVQRRDHYPHFTLFVTWHGQRIPLCWWRTTIGSWRSEVHEDGRIYMKYKNSDVGPRVWKHIVAAPVWIPPEGTPAKDLLTRKVFDRNVGPVTVVNTDVMGPGFQSAYGLVMAIHVDPKRGDFDNQIRTHGSVDYTSIARRFSHGCHRLVNNRAVRLFDFVLRHRRFRRTGSVPLSLKKRLEVNGHAYHYELKTRGYYYELDTPIAIDVLEGRIMGQVARPIVAFMRKPGVDYSQTATTGDATASTSTGTAAAPPEAMPAEAEPGEPAEPAAPETVPELGP
jgi:hypothetical protein